MRRITITALIGVAAFAALSTGCLDRKPAPVCPVPIEIASTRVTASDFDGVDLLVVVDNSGSMAEEQQILSTGFFTLINSLARPIESDNWEWPAVDNMRVAVVSSDMGLQFGEEGATDPSAGRVSTCEDLKGDDGQFLGTPMNVTTIEVPSGQIACVPGGGQCPAEFACEGGVCVAPGGIGTVNCANAIGANPGYGETNSSAPNDNLTVQVACLARQGTAGCGVEQQLEASLRGLEKRPEFLVKTHLLAVLIVSDEEDCSIKDKGLFLTPEWLSGPEELLNVACNYPPENDSYLFEPSRYYDRLVALKNAATAVIFAGIVGVPRNPQCEGSGDQIGECLSNPDMEMKLDQFETSDGYEYTHFFPACTRTDDATGEEVTSARPGRRYVQVAQLFGVNSYIYSICNPDWSPAMKKIAEIIARQITPTCYGKKLEWSRIPQSEAAAVGCPSCGKAKCDVVVEIPRSLNDPEGEKCPDSLYEGLTEAEKRDYLSRKEVVQVSQGGSVVQKKIICPLPKLPAPRNCQTNQESIGAGDFVSQTFPGRVGWYYCENSGEDFVDACQDQADNDLDGFIDCDDEGCKDCIHCGGTGVTCTNDKCRYGVEITQAGKDQTTGYFIDVQCLQQFRFEDPNCQENTYSACNNGVDDDGNGAWDCDMGDPNDPHLPDSNCCPMDVDATMKCVPDLAGITRNCGNELPWNEIPACAERIAELGCTP